MQPISLLLEEFAIYKIVKLLLFLLTKSVIGYIIIIGKGKT